MCRCCTRNSLCPWAKTAALVRLRARRQHKLREGQVQARLRTRLGELCAACWTSVCTASERSGRQLPRHARISHARRTQQDALAGSHGLQEGEPPRADDPKDAAPTRAHV
eukprot:6172672-Pleurochrysis_carterae.AAC.4